MRGDHVYIHGDRIGHLLRRETVHDGDQRPSIGGEAEFTLNIGLASLLSLDRVGIIRLRQVAVIGRTPDRLVDAVEDSDEIRFACPEQPVEAAAIGWGEDFPRIGQAHRRQLVAEADPGL